MTLLDWMVTGALILWVASGLVGIGLMVWCWGIGPWIREGNDR